MNLELVNLVEKIPNDIFYTFQYSGGKITTQEQELLTRFPNSSSTKRRGVAILLREVDLSLFEDEELQALLDLPLGRLLVNKASINRVAPILNPNVPSASINNVLISRDLEFDPSQQRELRLQYDILSIKFIDNINKRVISELIYRLWVYNESN